MDLDGTLTQHKTPLSAEHRAILTRLSRRVTQLRDRYGFPYLTIDSYQDFPKVVEPLLR